MKHGIAAALALAGLAVASNAEAQDNESGFYAGAGVGTYNIDIDDPDDVVDTIDRYSSDDTAWKAFVGWRVNPYLAFEGAYVNLGSPDDIIAPDTKLTVETDGFAPYVVGTLPIGDWFEVFAKAGYYWYDVTARVSSPLARRAIRPATRPSPGALGWASTSSSASTRGSSTSRSTSATPTRRTRSGSPAQSASDR